MSEKQTDSLATFKDDTAKTTACNSADESFDTTVSFSKLTLSSEHELQTMPFLNMATEAVKVRDEERERFVEFATQDAHPEYRRRNCLFLKVWHFFNEWFFKGALKKPHIGYAPLPGRSYARCSNITDYGADIKITFQESLFHIPTRNSIIVKSWPAQGTQLFLFDLLLHEMIHQFEFETSEDGIRGSNGGHTIIFCNKCNEIGKKLGLTRDVVTRNRKGGTEPVCVQWPYNVREPGYYLGHVRNINDKAAKKPRRNQKRETEEQIETILDHLQHGRIDDLNRFLEQLPGKFKLIHDPDRAPCKTCGRPYLIFSKQHSRPNETGPSNTSDTIAGITNDKDKITDEDGKEITNTPKSSLRDSTSLHQDATANVKPYSALESYTCDSLSEDHVFHCGVLQRELILDRHDFNLLWDEHPSWHHRIIMRGKEVEIPRWQAAYEKPYHFSGKLLLPEQTTPALLTSLLEWAQHNLDPRLNGILVNWYDGQQRHHITPHHDSIIGLVPDSPIVTISFGEGRPFRLYPDKQRFRCPLPFEHGKNFRDFPAENGVVFVMPWNVNWEWKHGIPHHCHHRERRISVTLRAHTDSLDDSESRIEAIRNVVRQITERQVPKGQMQCLIFLFVCKTKNLHMDSGEMINPAQTIN